MSGIFGTLQREEGSNYIIHHRPSRADGMSQHPLLLHALDETFHLKLGNTQEIRLPRDVKHHA